VLTRQQEDDIFNALIVGMAPEDAFLFAKLTPDEISWLQEDEAKQAWIANTQKQLEFNLLTKMHDGMEKQISVGRTDATQWMLEHLYPRYSAKAAPDAGTINFVLRKEDTSDIESVIGRQE
jgi:hypothetical protein